MNAGQITLARFINPAGLQGSGEHLRPDLASGEAEVAEANVDGYGAISSSSQSSNAVTGWSR